MDSLKTLIDKKEYELVIKLTESSTTANDLFYRISAYIYLNEYEKALFVIQDHQKTLESNLSTLINAHINLLCALGRFDQAYTTLDYYSNLPYQSQVVEETLRKMPSLIALEEEKQTKVKFYDDEQIEEYLKSDKYENVLMGLDIVKTRDVFTFLPIIENIMVNNPSQVLRSMALILLVKKEVDRPLKMKSLDEIIDINPKHLTPPFTGVIFNETVKLLGQLCKDVSISENAIHLLSEYVIYMYPRDLKLSPKELSVIFYVIARKYAANDIENLEGFLLEQGLNSEVTLRNIEQIESMLNQF